MSKEGTEEKVKHYFKVVILGYVTGKTAILLRYVEGTWYPNSPATTGAVLSAKRIQWDQETIVTLLIWEFSYVLLRYPDLCQMYYRGAEGAMVVCDVTYLSSLHEAQMWKENLDSKVRLLNRKPLPAVLLANKCDWSWEVPIEEIDECCRDNDFHAWFKTSAKENIGIDEAFRSLVTKMFENHECGERCTPVSKKTTTPQPKDSEPKTVSQQPSLGDRVVSFFFPNRAHPPLQTKKPYPQELEQYLVPPQGRPLKLGRKIGSGSYGTIYEVEVARRPCVAKRLHDILMGRELEESVGVDTKDAYHEKFIRECVLLSRMKHTNIVEFIGVHFGRDQYDLTLIMERLSDDLARYLNHHQDISFTQKVSILHDVSNGLLYMHKNSIIHRDLSAANIFLSSSLQAKIGDLGVSRVFDPTLTQLSKAPGTLAYMAPEALKDKAVYNEKVDIFSYGVIALFVAIQEFPEFSYDRVPDAVDREGEGEVFKRRVWIEKMKDRQPELCSLVLCCLRDNPVSRPNTAHVNGLVSELHKSSASGASV